MNGKLIIDAFFNLLVFFEYFVVDDFDGEKIASVPMSSFENLTVGPSTEKLSNLVAADHPTDGWI